MVIAVIHQAEYGRDQVAAVSAGLKRLGSGLPSRHSNTMTGRKYPGSNNVELALQALNISCFKSDPIYPHDRPDLLHEP